MNFLQAIDHSATSNATMTDSNGNIVWRPHNLLKYSEDFSAGGWSKTATTVTANAAVAPDGTMTADEISHTSTSAQISQAATSTDGVSYTVGIYVKYVDHQWFRIFADIGSVWFDIQNGVVGSTDASLTGTLTDIGSDWYYLTVEDVLASGASFIVIPLLASADLSIGEAVGTSAYIWGAHVYRSDLGGMADVPADARVIPSATKYVRTTSSAVYLPRRGHHVYNGSQWGNEGLLHESEARTNLVTYSEDFTGWINSQSTDAANSTTSPDGENNGTLITALNSFGSVYQTHTLSVSTEYCLSVYMKAGSSALSWISLYDITGADHQGGLKISWSGGVPSTNSLLGNATDARYEDVGNGWYRISVVATTDAVNTSHNFLIYPDNSAGTETVYIYGAQLEAGSTPSSYIPTSGATVTRAAETLTIPTANLPWPSPVYITNEELLSGSWATASSYDNTTSGADTSVSATGGTTVSRSYLSISGLSAGEVFTIPVTCDSVSSGGIQVYARDGLSPNSGTILGSHTSGLTTEQSVEFQFVALSSNVTILIQSTDAGASFSATASVKEINPLALSIQMDGRMTYADTDQPSEAEMFRWYLDGNNRIQTFLRTNVAPNDIRFQQGASGVFDTSDGGSLSPDILVPFNIAPRHGSTFINGAVDGVALTADTTPVGLPDLSATDLQLGYNFMGTIRTFRMWAEDIGDTGIAEATDQWILGLGVWNDFGYWDDNKTWNDAA